MAYEFKKLSDVNVIESISDSTNVLVEENGTIVKMAANNMIPEEVALKSDIPNLNDYAKAEDMIPAPATATIGQTVIVKAVDESGKPTEWEAADLSSENYVLLAEVSDAESEPSLSIDISFSELSAILNNGEIPNIRLVSNLGGQNLQVSRVLTIGFNDDEHTLIYLDFNRGRIMYRSNGALEIVNG